MKMRMFTCLLGVILGLSIGARPILAISDEEIIGRINEIREEQGLALLKVGRKLERAASVKLEDMQKYKYWSHNNPVTGELWWRNIYKAGVRGRAAENLARGYSDGKVAVEGWMSSSSHKSNILNASYRQIGLAIGEVEYLEGRKTVVITEFGE